MGYEYQKRIQMIIWDNEDYWCIDNEKESEELKEVYKKAEAFDEINTILDEYLGNVEDELNALNLIREKLEGMEDE